MFTNHHHHHQLQKHTRQHAHTCTIAYETEHTLSHTLTKNFKIRQPLHEANSQPATGTLENPDLHAHTARAQYYGACATCPALRCWCIYTHKQIKRAPQYDACVLHRQADKRASQYDACVLHRKADQTCPSVRCLCFTQTSR